MDAFSPSHPPTPRIISCEFPSFPYSFLFTQLPPPTENKTWGCPHLENATPDFPPALSHSLRKLPFSAPPIGLGRDLSIDYLSFKFQNDRTEPPRSSSLSAVPAMHPSFLNSLFRSLPPLVIQGNRNEVLIRPASYGM